jgi:hypothetical protein
MMNHLFVSLAIILVTSCRCSTPFSKSKSLAPDKSLTNKEARVQLNWQTRFEFALSQAGAGSEGWGLFADSPMGHSGQQLVIKYPNGTTKVCYAPQAKNDCSFENLDTALFEALMKVTSVADGLPDRPLQAFDTQNLEYLHLRNIGDSTNQIARVFFMLDHKPLPKDYDDLMESFLKLKAP